jgi:hypothetical protein
VWSARGRTELRAAGRFWARGGGPPIPPGKGLYGGGVSTTGMEEKAGLESDVAGIVGPEWVGGGGGGGCLAEVER